MKYFLRMFFSEDFKNSIQYLSGWVVIMNSIDILLVKIYFFKKSFPKHLWSKSVTKFKILIFFEILEKIDLKIFHFSTLTISCPKKKFKMCKWLSRIYLKFMWFCHSNCMHSFFVWFPIFFLCGKDSIPIQNSQPIVLIVWYFILSQ